MALALALRLVLANHLADIIPILNRNTLRHMVNLVHTHKSRRQLKHIISERDNDELGVLGAFFNVRGYDRDLFQVSILFLLLKRMGWYNLRF